MTHFIWCMYKLPSLYKTGLTLVESLWHVYIYSNLCICCVPLVVNTHKKNLKLPYFRPNIMKIRRFGREKILQTIFETSNSNEIADFLCFFQGLDFCKLTHQLFKVGFRISLQNSSILKSANRLIQYQNTCYCQTISIIIIRIHFEFFIPLTVWLPFIIQIQIFCSLREKT